MATTKLDAVKVLNISVQLLGTHSGRDKVAKTFHYLARIVKWWLQTKQKNEMADYVEQFRQAIGSSRRVGRFFSSLGSVPAILHYLSPQAKDTPSWLRTLLIVASVSDMFYYISDNLTFAAKYKFIHLSERTNYIWEELVGSWTWLVSVLIYLLNDFRTYGILLQKQKQMRQRNTPKKEWADLQEELYNLRLIIIRNLADLQLAVFFCFPNSWSSQMVGVFGMINAVVGIYQTCRQYHRSS